MKYRITHRTEYHYRDAVPLCHNVVHIRPRDTTKQTCIEYELNVDPAPLFERDGLDFFGNHVAWFSLQEPHRGLTIEAKSEVEVNAVPPDAACGAQPWEQAVATLREASDPLLRQARQYTFASPHIPLAEPLADFARTSFTPGRPLLEAATDLTGRIFREFKYKSGVTTIGTSVLDILTSRQGVCQDFAHLMIGGLRSLGLAARYVSGYLVTAPVAGQPRMIGADQSHAWVSLYCPGSGWIDFDPTNNVLPSDQHVTLGWARDYDDIAPVKGVIIGGRRHTMKVSVDVAPLVPSPGTPGEGSTPLPANVLG